MSAMAEATILVVDDDDLQRQYMAQKLRSRYSVIEAPDGPQAIESALQSLPDLILLDLVMEPMDGLECCRRFKQLPTLSEIPVIFLTGAIDVEEELRCFEVGAVDFVRKPANAMAMQARIGVQLGQKKLTDTLKERAWTDPLTGVANRSSFDECFEREWEVCKREKCQLQLILLDLDHFKDFNDHYGHLVGDDCLRQVASRVRELVRRPRDLFARYGGEEFACILPATDDSAALRLAEGARMAVEDLAIAHAKSAVAPVVTASLGLAGQQPDAQSSIRDLFEQADSRLYTAKRKGKNCVVAS